MVQRGPTSTFAAVSFAQGGYYLVTGLWPVVSIRTFQLITGRKRDLWLVKTSGLLIASIGLVLTIAGIRKNEAPEVHVLGMASAATLGSVDVVYFHKGILRWVYLADAVLEYALVAAWLNAWRTRSKG